MLPRLRRPTSAQTSCWRGCRSFASAMRRSFLWPAVCHGPAHDGARRLPVQGRLKRASSRAWKVAPVVALATRMRPPRMTHPRGALRGSEMCSPCPATRTASTPRKPLQGRRRAFIGPRAAQACPAERAPTRRWHTDGQGPAFSVGLSGDGCRAIGTEAEQEQAMSVLKTLKLGKAAPTSAPARRMAGSAPERSVPACWFGCPACHRLPSRLHADGRNGWRLTSTG